MIVSDAPNCGVTYNHHSDDYRGVIYDRNMFIVQAIGIISLGSDIALYHLRKYRL
jgi:hypothetical protein